MDSCIHLSEYSRTNANMSDRENDVLGVIVWQSVQLPSTVDITSYSFHIQGMGGIEI